MDTPTLIGSADAAKILGRSTRTVHRLVHDGLLKPAHTAPGGHHGVWLFLESDVQAIKDAREVEAA